MIASSTWWRERLTRGGDFFWWRFLYGLAILPVIAVIMYWREGELDQVSAGFVVLVIVWEVGVLALARWRRIWPFHER